MTDFGLARLGARAIKFILSVGSIIGIITLKILSGASSNATGELFKKHFETGGTFLDFNLDRLKKYYDEKFEKGKILTNQIQDDQKCK
ncbi:MAG TPA: hypothetical protein DCM04_01520 [Saprospirales bacterium]|nr:hypothetical protein [Saprospirales bacterium]